MIYEGIYYDIQSVLLENYHNLGTPTNNKTLCSISQPDKHNVCLYTSFPGTLEPINQSRERIRAEQFT